MGEVSYSLRPDELVEFGVDSDIGCAHEFRHPLFDLIDGLRGFSLELCAVGELVYVDGGVDCGLSESSPCFLLCHYH